MLLRVIEIIFIIYQVCSVMVCCGPIEQTKGQIMKSATIRARIEPELKNNVDHILGSLGVSTTDAITMFYKQIELQHGLPFKVELPNKETRRILDESDRGENLIECKDAQDMFDKLGI